MPRYKRRGTNHAGKLGDRPVLRQPGSQSMQQLDEATSLASPVSNRAWTISRVFHIVGEEFRHMLAPVIFFAIGFNLVVFSMNLILSEYFLRFGSFMVA